MQNPKPAEKPKDEKACKTDQKPTQSAHKPDEKKDAKK